MSQKLVLADQVRFEEIPHLRLPLVDRFYKAQNAKVTCGKNERVFTLAQAPLGFIAAVRLFEFPSKSYWLRNMMVHRECRNQGVGRLLMNGICSAIPNQDIYCYSLIEVTEFYQKLGFSFVGEKETAPDIWGNFSRYKARGRDWVLMKLSQQNLGDSCEKL